MKIPFNKIYLTGNEIKYIQDALNRGQLSGDGYYTKKVSTLLRNKFKLNEIFMTTSGTHALEMAADLINLKDGDEVIMPSFTFTSTANSVLLKGGKVVFSEICEDTLNLDPEKIEQHITEKTKAVIPVHYAGVSCRMDEIKEIAEKYNLYVIEDAAHAVNARYKGNYLGGIGDFGCFSFHGSKNYVSGEGGALLINSKNKGLIEKAEIIREKGTNRSRFLRGDLNKYTWLDKGSSYLPSDLLMAFLLAQLEKMDKIKNMRKKIYSYYYQRLSKYRDYKFLDLISYIPEYCDSSYHIFFLKFNKKSYRDYVIIRLKKAGVNASFHYLPLHSSPMGKKMGYKENDFSITNKAADTILRLPLYPDLTAKELSYIADKLENIFCDLCQ
ncbi:MULTISPECIES: dTDP-4-amino-4,6-dideoxygalactose transaminase [unclassified Halanaerobium]|uniref:dTDP-4-amino-4,6-dideoxygalactose transaminase n=1 Tax=unclassified Halanaerobium TaxID=2641197 RepID=UPI000DF11AE8|nr:MULTISPECIES: dTDP-4-amino-4,6-dideoxygalactose transaminase [unclassified Halanaerobium]